MTAVLEKGKSGAELEPLRPDRFRDSYHARIGTDSIDGFWHHCRDLQIPTVGWGGWRLFVAALSCGWLAAATVGCSVYRHPVALPDSSMLERDQLVIHSDFYLPRKHRLISELTARRGDISRQLSIPVSDEPIHIFLFKREPEYRNFMQHEHPEFPARRAFFVKNDTTLKVYAFWGERVGEDLRHEVTHGYLHSVIPNLPLWLDEGLAEYYEMPRGTHGLNWEHVYLLVDAFCCESWQPDLEALEALQDPASMSQLQYAEAWLWIHFLLESDMGEPRLLQDQLARLRMAAESQPLSHFVSREIECKEVKLVEHLKQLAVEP